MRRALLLVLLVLASSSFASQLWQFGTDAAVSAKPVIYQNAVIIASDDGNIYAIETAGPNAGLKRWQTPVGKMPNEVFLFDNAVVASTTNGKVVKIGPTGTPIWTLNLNTSVYNVSYVYGAAANSKFIFVTTDRGVFEVDNTGAVKLKLLAANRSIMGPPGAGADYVVFGKGNELYKISESGTVLWKISLQGGSFWLSRPVLDGNGIFIGATDNRLHYYAASNGIEFWNVRTRGWVAGTPLLQAGTLYFGSDDGKVYAVDSGGQIIWTAQTQLAVQTQPEMGIMGGKEVIFVGGSDKSIYAISTVDGQIVWKGPSESAVGSPLFYQNNVFFGSGDGRVYAYSTERACSITNPREADVVGLKELVVTGKFVSEAGGASVYVSVNEGDWQQANASDVDWVYFVDPKKSLNPALNTISCKVSDASGDEMGPTYTTVVINHDDTQPLSDLVVTISPSVMEKKPFTIFVNDGDDGSPVDRFTIGISGNNHTSDRNYTLTINEPGTYFMNVTKMGFKPATISVEVNASGVNPIFMAIGIVVIIAVIWYALDVMKKRSASRARRR